MVYHSVKLTQLGCLNDKKEVKKQDKMFWQRSKSGKQLLK